ncbi:hypothetical protein BRC90_05700 [Halobacteriales archaeon QS_4_69_34]|nr:MAG: hypothetical protein BRC90_05700 [Halobacteriales archaeon QS_4_69_34]
MNPEPVVHTTREAFRATAHDARADARIPVEVRVAVDDPFEAYRRARHSAGEGGFYLETGGGRPGWGHFGVDPVAFHTVEAADAAERGDAADTVENDGDTDAAGSDREDSLAALAAFLEGETLVRGACEIPYPCGVVGWLSYDIARELESLPDDARDDRGLPRLQLGHYDRVAAWEIQASEAGAGSAAGVETTLRVTACPRVDDPDAAYEAGRERARGLARAAIEGDPAVDKPASGAAVDDRVGGESDAGLAEAVAAVFPGGTITGAPKPRTMELIDAVETTRRGPYTGSAGIFGFDGRATLSILIRTLVRHRGEYHLRVGAGIVDDSDPDREYDETLDKARGVLEAVDAALGERAGTAVEGR